VRPSRSRRREPEVGERTLAIEVNDEVRDLAVADVEQIRRPRPQLPDLQPTRLAPPAAVGVHENALVIELLALVRLDAALIPRAQEFAHGPRRL
jgi:hypothetical protein